MRSSSTALFWTVSRLPSPSPEIRDRTGCSARNRPRGRPGAPETRGPGTKRPGGGAAGTLYGSHGPEFRCPRPWGGPGRGQDLPASPEGGSGGEVNAEGGCDHRAPAGSVKAPGGVDGGHSGFARSAQIPRRCLRASRTARDPEARRQGARGVGRSPTSGGLWCVAGLFRPCGCARARSAPLPSRRAAWASVASHEGGFFRRP